MAGGRWACEQRLQWHSLRVEPKLTQDCYTTMTNHPVHFALSNQSPSQATLTLRLSVDQRSIFDGTLESKDLHNWRELTETLEEGPHTIEVQETQTGTNQQTTVQIKGETWIAVMFFSPPPSISVTSQESPLNFV